MENILHELLKILLSLFVKLSKKQTKKIRKASWKVIQFVIRQMNKPIRFNILIEINHKTIYQFLSTMTYFGLIAVSFVGTLIKYDETKDFYYSLGIFFLLFTLANGYRYCNRKFVKFSF